MKKYFFVCAVMALVSGADAATTCTVTASGSYMSCKSGYYYDKVFVTDTEKKCYLCPLFKPSVYGESVNKNTEGVTSCYLPAGTTGSDSTGTFKYTAPCYYRTN